MGQRPAHLPVRPTAPGLRPCGRALPTGPELHGAHAEVDRLCGKRANLPVRRLAFHSAGPGGWLDVARQLAAGAVDAVRVLAHLGHDVGPHRPLADAALRARAAWSAAPRARDADGAADANLSRGPAFDLRAARRDERAAHGDRCAREYRLLHSLRQPVARR